MNDLNEKYLYTPINDKSLDQVNVWMAFPGPESFAMSSLGYFWLFKQLDENPEINTAIIEAANNTDLDPKAVALGAYMTYALLELSSREEISFTNTDEE